MVTKQGIFLSFILFLFRGFSRISIISSIYHLFCKYNHAFSSGFLSRPFSRSKCGILVDVACSVKNDSVYCIV